MIKPSDLPSGNRVFSSFVLSLILVGSIISSTSLLGLTQRAFAAPPTNAPAGLSPGDGSFTANQTPTFQWNRVTGANPATKL